MDRFLENDGLLLGAVAFVAGLLITSAIVVAFVVLIPADHFVAPRAAMRRRLPSPVARFAYLAGKNALGVLLVIAGVLLSLPGVPGQGLLTILVGIMLLDIPGKRRLELRIVGRPRIRRGLDRIRGRFGRAPLRTEPEPPGPDAPDGDGA
ncbi:MAG: hypothetical protein JRI23_24645 [Deltaproteobacteria bacterium]|jgi:hypothetical protein|nr:hypothetical protein [Deltaproteobacteria bacterium]MBW2535192.1 hypothetical protein [Deltaproteobacteria bacterium]